MSSPINEQAAPSDASATRRGDVAIALKNTVKLGASLLITWTVALVVRFQLPRHLGPETFGQLNFCDAFAGAFFVFIGLGVDTYIQKEIPVRPKHATEFFGGILLARALLSVPLLAMLAFTLAATGHPAELQIVAIVFGLNHFVYALNNSFSTMLQSSTKVGALAIVNVASKVMWGVGLVAAIWMDAKLVVLAATFLISELVRTALLLPALRSTIGLKLELHFDTAKRALIASLPFYGTMVAINLGHRLDVSMLEFMASHIEVGWYSAAANFATLAMLLSPLVSWVLMPLLARARHRSLEEFFAILRRALEAILVTAIPVTLMMALGADFWVHLAFGESFAPSAPTLQLMAPMFVATYLAMLCSNALILLGRPWLLTIVSVVGLCVGPMLILAMVPLLSGYGPGGAGMGAALGLVGTESFIAGLLLYFVGKSAFDRRSVSAISKSVLLCVAVSFLHVALAGLGAWRLLIDILVYTAGALATGAVEPSAVREVARMLFQRKAPGSS